MGVFYVSYFSGVYRLYSQENSLVTYFWNHCSAQTNVSIPGSNSKAINPLSAATLLHRALARLWQCTRPACVCVCVHCAVCKATSFQLCLLLMLEHLRERGAKEFREDIGSRWVRELGTYVYFVKCAKLLLFNSAYFSC